ncbi:MAG: hypothetical protein EHM18_07235 [Acidobacteria bacterium]|nr:MAG: hypothetical protein EHM18_07235 [Acidobacteriota bacterium]
MDFGFQSSAWVLPARLEKTSAPEEAARMNRRRFRYSFSSVISEERISVARRISMAYLAFLQESQIVAHSIHEEKDQSRERSVLRSDPALALMDYDVAIR